MEGREWEASDTLRMVRFRSHQAVPRKGKTGVSKPSLPPYVSWQRGLMFCSVLYSPES